MTEPNPTPEELRASIVPKSDQLSAEDLVTGPMTVTIKGVRRGEPEQPINVDLVETPGRAYRPCKSMRRVLIAAYTDDPKQWIGKRLTLYCDPNVTWAGVKVGGIRISHMSGLDKPSTFLLTQTRGKKLEYTIHPLSLSPTEEAYIADATEEIRSATTREMLKAIGFILAKKSKAVQDTLRPIYAARQAELQEPQELTE
jgi:hypothetical protein